MNRRTWTLLGLTAALALAYVFMYTDWVSPEPIQIASQVRPVIQQPRFGRRPRPNRPPGGTPGRPDANGNVVVRRDGGPPPDVQGMPPLQGGTPDGADGKAAEPANGVAYVTFSLDDRYALTALKVVEVRADGAPGRIMWNLQGKSHPLNGLIYGMKAPPGMVPVSDEGAAAPLEAGIQYRIEVASGRRKGTNVFQTVVRPPPVE
jgi:hypothetical protein